MNVYVETNFILELAFVQEQHDSCEEILKLCEAGKANLILPAFCIAEAYENLIRRVKKRKNIINDLTGELQQLSRSKPYKHEVDEFQEITGLLVRSSQEEDERLILVLEKILKTADVVPLQADIVLSATQYRAKYKLEPQDSIIYSSVLYNLALTSTTKSCFINRNSRDFDDPDIEESLMNHNCKMLFKFSKGYDYIQHCVSST